MCVRCISSTTAESMPVGSISSFFHSACRFSGASLSVAFGSSDQANCGHEEIRQVAGDLQIVRGRRSRSRRSCAASRRRLRIADLVIAALALRHQLERAHQHAAVVGVGRRARGDLAQQVARRDGVGIGAADAQLGFGRDAARPHVAEPAAHAVGAELALRLLGLVTIPHSRRLGIVGDCNHLIGCRIA